MAEQHAHSDLLVARVSHGEVREIGRDRGVQVDLALLHQLHDGHRGQRLGDGSLGGNGLGGHRPVACHVGKPKPLVVNHLVIFDDAHFEPRSRVVGHGRLHDGVDFRRGVVVQGGGRCCTIAHRLVLDAREVDVFRRQGRGCRAVSLEFGQQESSREVVDQVVGAVHVPDRIGAEHRKAQLDDAGRVSATAEEEQILAIVKDHLDLVPGVQGIVRRLHIPDRRGRHCARSGHEHDRYVDRLHAVASEGKRVA